jgi:hypothetical protein
MTGTIDYSDVLVRVQQQRKKYAETIDNLFSELESHTEDIINATDPEDLWNYRDHMEEMRATVYKLKKSAGRNHAEIQDGYRDGVRASMARVQNTNGLHFSEREAKYEMQFITEYKILNNLERMVEDLDKFSWYLEGRLRWVKDRQRMLEGK